MLARRARTIANSPADELVQVLRFVMVKVGLRAAGFPSEQETMILVDHVVKNYGNHTNEEIKLAFDMAISGKLNCEIICYENFSCLYFSGVMNSYRIWAKDAIKEIKEPVKTESRPMTKDEWAEWLERIRTYPLDIVPITAYDYLLSNGLDESKVDKPEYKKRAIEYQTQKFDTLDPERAGFLKWKENQKTGDAWGLIIRGICKKMVVKDYLNKTLCTKN